MEFSALSTYLSGWIFSDDPEFYDSSGKVWYDQGQYGANFDTHCTVSVGTPTFADVEDGRGWVMDNTCQAFAHCPCPWEGVLVTIMKGGMTGNGTVYPMIFGAATTVTSNPTLRFIRSTASSFNRRLAGAGGGASNAQVSTSNQDALVAVHSLLQSERKVRATADGTTFVEGSVIADDGSGLPTFCGNVENAEYGFKTRIGNLSGTIGDASASAHTLTLCEAHWLRPESLTTGLTDLQAGIAAGNAKYAP